jgi:hypothetical protein
MPFRPFFLPSNEITNHLLTSMGQRRARVLQEAAGNYQETEDDASESEELAESLLAALEDEREQLPEHDWEDQRWLSDIMYHLMGRLAGRARRQGVRRLMTTDKSIIEGMSTSLGLYEPQDLPLFKELTAEFLSWLSDEPSGSYPAGWGRIVREPYRKDVFYLEPFDRDSSAPPPENEIEPEQWEISVGVGGTATALNAAARLAESECDT